MFQISALIVLGVLAGAPVAYESEVAPLLQRRCAGCHAGDEKEGGFSIDSIDAMVRGGEHGPALTPGQPESSRLWLMAAGKMEPRMPPKDEEPLTEEEVALLGRWIETGATGPAGALAPRRELMVPKIARATDSPLPITAVAISPDGVRIATARGHEVTHSALDGSNRQSFASGRGKITSLQFSPQGDRLAVATGLPGVYGEATIYRLGDNAEERRFGEHRDLLYDAAWSPDGTKIATAGYDRVIRLWDVSSGRVLATFTGHNGAVYDLDFSRDGNVLASASADNTVKLWKTSTGERLDTLGQAQKEALAVAFSPDNQWIVTGSSDQRLRMYRFVSKDRAEINPLIDTRFADESPIVKLAFKPDGKRLAVVSQAGNVKWFETERWTQVQVLGKLSDLGTGIIVGNDVRVAEMSGQIARFDLPADSGTAIATNTPSPSTTATPSQDAVAKTPVPDAAAPVAVNEQEGNDSWETAQALAGPSEISGVVSKKEGSGTDEDWFRFDSVGGREWMIEVNAERSKSKLDSLVEIRDAKGDPVERLRLQAVRDSYFTFRGKDSDTSDDFRMFAWEEMELDEYLYAAGEVVRLWMYPRGPDSGFKVYPGEGKRWTFFDTSPLAHALAEPAYIVRPLDWGQPPLANGLPVFSIKYVNDDDPRRRWGADSCLRFIAPTQGTYLIRLRDTRGEGGDEYTYKLTLRPAVPKYSVNLAAPDKPIPRGAGREFTVRVQREDGFNGPVEVFVENLPRGVHATSPLVVEPGQVSAEGILYADVDAPISENPFTPTAYTRADFDGAWVKQDLAGFKPLKVAERPKVQVLIEPADAGQELTSVDPKMLEGADSKAIELPKEGPVATSPWTLRLKRGETVPARLVVLRDGFEQRVEFGKEGAGRNLPYAVFVDNIGLNGLMVPEGASRRTFFITAAPVAHSQRRLFYLKAEVDGGITSWPVVLALE